MERRGGRCCLVQRSNSWSPQAHAGAGHFASLAPGSLLAGTNSAIFLTKLRDVLTILPVEVQLSLMGGPETCKRHRELTATQILCKEAGKKQNAGNAKNAKGLGAPAGHDRAHGCSEGQRSIRVSDPMVCSGVLLVISISGFGGFGRKLLSNCLGGSFHSPIILSYPSKGGFVDRVQIRSTHSSPLYDHT